MTVDNLLEMSKTLQSMIDEVKSGETSVDEVREILKESQLYLAKMLFIVRDVLTNTPNDELPELMRYTIKEQLVESLKNYDVQQSKEDLKKILDMASIADKEINEELIYPFMLSLLKDGAELMNLIDDRNIGDELIEAINKYEEFKSQKPKLC